MYIKATTMEIIGNPTQSYEIRFVSDEILEIFRFVPLFETRYPSKTFRLKIRIFSGEILDFGWNPKFRPNWNETTDFGFFFCVCENRQIAGAVCNFEKLKTFKLLETLKASFVWHSTSTAEEEEEEEEKEKYQP